MVLWLKVNVTFYPRFFLLATNQLPLSPVQIQPSPPYYRQPSQDDGRKVYETGYFSEIPATALTFDTKLTSVYFQSESPSRKRRRISRNGAVSGIEVRETTPPSPTPPLHTTPPPWEFSAAPQRRSPRNHMPSTRGSPTIRNRYQRYTDSFGLSYPFVPGHTPLPPIHSSHHGLLSSHHNIHNSHHNLHNSHHNMHNAHQTHPHHPPGTGHHPAQGANGPVVVEVGQLGLEVTVSREPLWHPPATGYRIPCQLHGIYTPTGAFAHSCQV